MRGLVKSVDDGLVVVVNNDSSHLGVFSYLNGAGCEKNNDLTITPAGEKS